VRALALFRVIAVVCAGFLAGILFGDRAGATYARPRLDPSSFVQFQQVVHAHFVRFMPPLIVAAILGGLAWLVSIRARWRGAEFWLVAVSTAAILFILVATRAVNVPINEQLMRWSVTDPPANVRELWAPWERVHTLRTIAAAWAFLLEAVALARRAADGAHG